MPKTDKSIIFMGTPEFAVPTLEAIHEEFGVQAVVTVPDKPKGRGKKLSPSPVKEKAIELGLPVLQPEKLKDPAFIEELAAYQPDIMAVLAFRILPEEVFELSTIGTFNIHGSLLPKYRGAAPINWTIINGDTETGLTSFLLKKKVDTGDMLLQQRFKIPEGYTAGDLHDSLMPISAQLGVDTINLLLDDDYKLMPQDDSLASPAPKLFRENCEIKWAQHARDLRNYIHGVSPIPGAWTTWNGKRMKVLRVEYNSCGKGTPGEFYIENGQFFVHCQKGIITLKEIQVQGKRAMKAEDFLKGYRGETDGKFE